MEVFSREEHKKKLDEDARLGALVGKVSKEIPKVVILESLKTLSIEEVHKKAANKAIMVDGELVFEEVIDESTLAQFELKAKQAK